MMARPSTLSFRMLLKHCFKMKNVKRHCLEDKVEANYLFHLTRKPTDFDAKTDRFGRIQAVLYFRSFAVRLGNHSYFLDTCCHFHVWHFLLEEKERI